MSNIPSQFNAFRIHNDDDGYRSGVESISMEDLTEGEVTIQVAWSGINFKDALAATGKGKGKDGKGCVEEHQVATVPFDCSLLYR